MATTNEQEQSERNVSLIISIRIDSVPLSEVAALEAQAFDLGDEWGAQVDINKGAPRGTPPAQ